eukprot:gene13836-4049_t
MTNNTARVFIGQITYESDETQVTELFSAYGTVLACNVQRDRTTGKSKGAAFVTFSSTDEADSGMRTKQDGELSCEFKFTPFGPLSIKTIKKPINFILASAWPPIRLVLACRLENFVRIVFIVFTAYFMLRSGLRLGSQGLRYLNFVQLLERFMTNTKCFLTVLF